MSQATKITIQEAANLRSKTTAWRISALVTSVFALLVVGFLSWNTYFRVETGIAAVRSQLTNFLTLGDSFQIKAQLLSLSSSGLVDHFVFREPGGFTIVGDGERERGQDDSWLAPAPRPSVRWIDGRLHLVRTFEIPTALAQPAVLTVAKRIHLEIFWLLIAVKLLVFAIVRWILRREIQVFASALTAPMSRLADAVTSAGGAEELANDRGLKSDLKYQEVHQTFASFLELLARLASEEKRRREAETTATLAGIASQVAHDIRSPLTALNILIKKADGIPEDERIMLRAATQRIKDIANNLLTMSKAAPKSKPPELERGPVLLPAIVDAVVSETRVQLREHHQITLDTEGAAAYGVFVQANSTELSRVLSNLITNAVEAFEAKRGLIRVSIVSEKERVILSVEDNGRGIPGHLIERLGRERITHGKSGPHSGHGLGLLHARQTLQAFGGDLQIVSVVGSGTRVNLLLPAAATPAWFLDHLKISTGALVVSVDDDPTIHQVWASRLKPLSRAGQISHVAHATLEGFEAWMRATHPPQALYLIDHEFVGHVENGLEVIERLALVRSAVLVTSRYDEPALKATAARLGVKMLPKTLAAQIPIHITAEAPLTIAFAPEGLAASTR